ncbi:7-cyano-7-deazaguanine synthase (queuosine biosynthesis) [Brevibacterium aurantiacum]|uniref:7-cyano-7-deazaguanine synthase (Queuosine biosynthesis) n=1 Tax=Brevibacterium aurantiacum TaxID=273384 RepID=A0A2H1JK05_BREAU|nr:queuosine biosynthesis protein queC [Brevibacterium aurantiacum]SMX87674.1 7-cyano-7-deazaguanine synthase (queuosine biosynthesis) [Brevibacterium aurantiacum]
MPLTHFYVSGEDSANPTPDDHFRLRWPTAPGETDTVKSAVGWWLPSLGPIPSQAIDLVRIAGGAYLVDRLSGRPASFTRRLQLTVEVADSAPWEGEAINQLAQLLFWLTGDTWELQLVQDPTSPEEPVGGAPDDAESVALLSGGLDSYLGALHLLSTLSEPPLFVGHYDTATAVRQAQNTVHSWLQESYTPAPSYTQMEFTQAADKKEASSRSRSLLFVAFGVAVAASRNASTLFVPENGFTSLNLPLHPNRAGALSTRSTHPETFYRVNTLLRALGLTTAVTNPFASYTKGEEMRLVADSHPPAGWDRVAGLTVSCSKLDGARIKGGNSTLNCGLCYACVTRRGAFIGAGIADPTIYLSNEFSGDARLELLDRRYSDRAAISYATTRGIDDDVIDAGTWPPDADLDLISDLARRGLDELGKVDLT